ncbi:MAG: DUF1858 domain-containing protein [candidate division Zixibacteria bacterium]|nr:DUF1858 domain-containing protein [candidate division Zixibacteria bacterium]
MKVAEFLKYYPELENVLIEISPAFAKLKNPVLRKTVAKVASLGQAAAVGDVPVGDLINKLRKAAGITGDFEIADNTSSQKEKPEWFSEEKIIETFDARPIIEKGEQPLTVVFQKLNKLDNGQILEIITPFYPAPMVDKAQSTGLEVWSNIIDSDITESYFYKPL